ncbi:hypothetical protein [Sphingobium sp. YR768]|uniref:hypothetical protein n=1 Tax=Sphingobium sp. YR768 TaxID=1884365 RepID=UPI0008AC06A1|nr:hypothetical protein [Sphingobium sp. YR768]SES13695.1 hypothetical protein SAMN05518866_14321 [Sphingobium sp. YR768]
MDAGILYERLKGQRLPAAMLKVGPTLVDIRIKKLHRGSAKILGSYIPGKDAIVKICVDHLSVEGVVRVRNDVQCSIAFLRPARAVGKEAR